MNNKSIRKNIVFGVTIFFIGALTSTGIILNTNILPTEKEVKEVTITDTGISYAVDKVYDSVIVVSTYKDNTLSGTGSGFIYKVDDNNTYIITNHHVIDNGNNYKITYTDGEVLDGILVGSDEYSDIAVLKVDTRDNYSAVSLGDTLALKAGDTTFAIGSPLGEAYSYSVTRGIISGKNRLVEISLSNSSTSDYIINVIQTDAAVNSGNSGGPLCNTNGEVIGVISSKIASTGIEGMGFAIPIDTVIEKANTIINGDNITYPYLGISIMNLEDIKNNYRYNINTNLTSGVVVMNIETSSSASNSDLKEGDIITKINNIETKNIAYLRYELYKYSVGDTITITYERNNKEYTTNIKLDSINKIL